MVRTFMPSRLALLTGLLLLVPAGTVQAQSSVVCADGQVLTSPPAYADVLVSPGVTCTIDGASLVGSVHVEGGRLTIRDSQVLGDVVVSDTPSTTRLIRSSVFGSLTMDRAGAVDIDQGSLSDIAVKHSQGPLQITGVELAGDVSIENGRGDITVAEVTGGEASDLTIMERLGSIEVIDSNVGNVTVEGTGRPVIFEGVFIDGDMSVAESGRVALRRSGSGRPSALDGNVAISEAAGKVSIFDITTAGNVTVADSGAVAFRRNDASNEDVQLHDNSGPVLVEGNVRLGLSLDGNGEVGVYGNDFDEAELNANTGDIGIGGNAGTSLTCEDNMSTPEDLGGNAISERSGGQCTGF